MFYLPYGANISSSSLKQEIAKSFDEMVESGAASSNRSRDPHLII